MHKSFFQQEAHLNLKSVLLQEEIKFSIKGWKALQVLLLAEENFFQCANETAAEQPAYRKKKTRRNCSYTE